MLTFYAENFVQIGRLIAYARGMVQFPVQKFSDTRMVKHHTASLSGTQRGELATAFKLLRDSCMEIKLELTVDQIDRILTGISDDNYTHGQAARHLEDLELRMTDELKRKHFISLSSLESDLFRNPRQGWNKVIERWPETTDDIIEAMKCFALSRYTAAVFHSLQVVEIGIIKLGEFVQVSDPK